MDSSITQAPLPRVPPESLSVLEVASVVVRQRRLLLGAAFVGSLLGGLGAIFSPRMYTAEVSFLTHNTEQAGLANVGGLAQRFGFSLPGSSGSERSPEFYQNLLRSRQILGGVVESEVELVTPAGVTLVDLAEHFEIEGETAEERHARTRRHLNEKVISVRVAQEIGVVTVAVRTDRPELSAAIAGRLLDLVTAFDLETRQSQASAERGFAGERLGQLESELGVAEDSLKSFLDENRQFSNSPQLIFEHDRLQRRVAMRQELVTAMAQAYEQARIDEVRNTPVITVIDQPEPPALPDPRGRVLILALGLTLGVMAGFGLALVREFGERAKRGDSQAYGEFQEVIKDAKGDLFGLRSSRSTPSAVDPDA